MSDNRKEFVMGGRLKLGAVVVASVIVAGADQVALAQAEWTIEGVVVPPGGPGTWDQDRHMLGGVVFDGTTYHLHLAGGQGSAPIDYPWSVGHWTWVDTLAEWEPDDSNPVLVPEPGQWETGIGSIAVLYHGAMFHMWYSAAASTGAPSYVGYATSPGGSV